MDPNNHIPWFCSPGGVGGKDAPDWKHYLKNISLNSYLRPQPFCRVSSIIQPLHTPSNDQVWFSLVFHLPSPLCQKLFSEPLPALLHLSLAGLCLPSMHSPFFWEEHLGVPQGTPPPQTTHRWVLQCWLHPGSRKAPKRPWPTRAS